MNVYHENTLSHISVRRDCSLKFDGDGRELSSIVNRHVDYDLPAVSHQL